MATSPIYSWPEPDNTDLVKNGALAIRTLGNAIDTTMATMTPKSIVDAKGDLIAASANDTPARLAVGSNGETLVADSSTSTGLRYNANFAAGKNKVLNADFSIWQRGTSITANGLAYTTDRWQTFGYSGATSTVSQQTFTPGTAPVAGYEGQYFMRINATNTRALLQNVIEDVRTLAGQTVTLSFWAKSQTSQTLERVYIGQAFGSGGSASIEYGATPPTVTTSWARYSFTINLGSLAGKTIGTGSSVYIQIFGAINNALDIWGVQLEAGSVATAFQTATGTIQGELAACQRYYQRITGGLDGPISGGGIAATATLAAQFVIHKVSMRTAPTAVDFSFLSINDTITSIAVTNCTINTANTHASNLTITVASGFTVYRPYNLVTSGSSGYLGLSAEL